MIKKSLVTLLIYLASAFVSCTLLYVFYMMFGIIGPIIFIILIFLMIWLSIRDVDKNTKNDIKT